MTETLSGQLVLTDGTLLGHLRVDGGRITAIEGADRLQREFGQHVVWNTLLGIGTPRRDWRKTLVSDGFIMLRHADLDKTLAMADTVGSELHLYAA